MVRSPTEQPQRLSPSPIQEEQSSQSNISSTSPGPPEQERSIMDIIEDKFPTFDHESVVHHFEEDTLRDLEFQKRT
jgi:hypothetical protein